MIGIRRVLRIVLLASALSLVAGCGVKSVDVKQEGFPCNPDGSCKNGLVCYQDKCMLPAHVPGDGGTTDAGVTDAGMPDAGPTDAGTPDAGPTDAGPTDAGTPDAGTCVATGSNACAPCDNGTGCSIGSLAGVCRGGLCSPGCLVGDVLYATGAHSPTNDCQICDPTVSPTSFIDESDGTACTSDNDDCTTDACSAGVCKHVALTDGTPCTDDGNPCTDDTCGSGVCTHPDLPSGTTCASTGRCDGNGVCSIGCDIGSVHYNAGDPNPQNACQQCEPSTSTNGWSNDPAGTACDDGNACTRTDICQNGICSGGNPVVCTAAGACYDAGTCDPTTGNCSNPMKPNGSSCNDGHSCTSNDTCTNGVCAGTDTCASPCICYGNVCKDISGGLGCPN